MSNLEGRVERGIRKLVENLVQDEYEARGHHNVKPQVDVKFQSSISVTINTETPFLGEGFWEFVSKVGARLDNAVKVFGFVYKETKFIYDYCVIFYEFKVE